MCTYNGICAIDTDFDNLVGPRSVSYTHLDCVGGRGNKIYDHLGSNVIDGTRFQKGHTDKAYTAV